jgi:hypothetical protein
MNRPVQFVVLLAVSVAATTSPAFAGGSGVTVDPNSPTAKEYALPLDSARHDAGGGGTAKTPGKSSPLFGAGVTRDQAAAPAAAAAAAVVAGTAGGGGRKRGRTGKLTSGLSTAAATVPMLDRASTSNPTASVGGSGSSTALVGGGAVILLLAALGGFALRAVRRPESH